MKRSCGTHPQPRSTPLAAPAGRRNLRIAALVGLAVLFLSGCATGMGEATRAPEVAGAGSVAGLRAQALAALETRRAARAKQLFEALLAQAPDDPEALMGLGEAEVLLGELGTGLEHSRKAAERSGDRAGLKARALHNGAIALLLTGRAEEAEQALEAAVANDPESWRAWNALGRARDAAGRWEDARGAYERALALAPSEGLVLNNLGLSRLGAGDLDAATALFVRALEASPDLAAAETNLRLALALRGRYDEALAGVDAGHMPAALNNAGYAALLRGDYAQSRVLLLRAIDASPSFYEPAWSNLRFLSSVEQRQELATRLP